MNLNFWLSTILAGMFAGLTAAISENSGLVAVAFGLPFGILLSIPYGLYLIEGLDYLIERNEYFE